MQWIGTTFLISTVNWQEGSDSIMQQVKMTWEKQYKKSEWTNPVNKYGF